ncbi:DUF3791 domain-containing protein [Clostridium gasigenes]|uniref:DUF3791 domain-containing protein n=1 Tax=Clostridium gasigenes TaxID=94869 RepID=A0A7X0SDW2_9CLOT|nr:DUF3791 domain-containing protein [Clostridium gasigenes]MBB6714548.1 DUF3791 domain-containing protein [Clostridium gasigenes]MBU3109814.1 DUF3791 domain-containing protein [Clostridium gasigenes]NKF08733.1 DUF3791 domain-containing protein [Clostridium gasigenes]QSW19980.1 DUF3791 domain-containing protein [Clostridium gasigenes]
MKNLYSGDVIIEFISFCIENFKMEHNMKGKEVANLFNQSGVIDFLTDGYDILHTQGKGYIIDEIEQFLKKRGYKI